MVCWVRYPKCKDSSTKPLILFFFFYIYNFLLRNISYYIETTKVSNWGSSYVEIIHFMIKVNGQYEVKLKPRAQSRQF